MVNRHLRASNSKVYRPIWPEIELFQELMPVQYICKCHNVSIKAKQAIVPDKADYFSIKGQVTPKWIVQSG